MIKKQMDMMVGGSYGSYDPDYNRKTQQQMKHISPKVQQMLESRVPEIMNLGKILKQEEDTKYHLHLEVIKKMMILHPEIIVTGSTALFLHGVRLKRWREGFSDLDIIIPYYIQIEDNLLNELVFRDTDYAKSPNSDFDYVTTCNGHIKIDWKIDPKCKYKRIVYEDFTYKVSPLEVVVEAKSRYAIQGNMKHKKDIEEMCQPPVAASHEDSNFEDLFTPSTTTTSTVQPKYTLKTS